MHVDVAGLEQVDLIEVIAPIPLWREVLQLAHTHLVVVFDRVAQLHACARRFSQFRLQRHNPFRIVSGFLGRLA